MTWLGGNKWKERKENQCHSKSRRRRRVYVCVWPVKHSLSRNFLNQVSKSFFFSIKQYKIRPLDKLVEVNLCKHDTDRDKRFQTSYLILTRTFNYFMARPSRWQSSLKLASYTASFLIKEGRLTSLLLINFLAVV